MYKDDFKSGLLDWWRETEKGERRDGESRVKARKEKVAR